MFYIKLIFNFILNFILFLLFTFSLMSFYFGYTLLNFIISTCITVIFSVLYKIISKKFQLKKGVKIKSLKKFSETYENLLLLNNKQLESIFNNVLPKDTFFFISQKSFDISDLTSLIKKLNEKQLSNATVCVNSITSEAALKIDNIENFNIKILTIKELYSIIEENNLKIPQVLKLKSKSKLSFKQFCSMLINKKLIKTYLMLGLFFMFYSILVPFSLYYKVFACIVFALAVCCVFIPKFKNISGT